MQDGACCKLTARPTAVSYTRYMPIYVSLLTAGFKQLINSNINACWNNLGYKIKWWCLICKVKFLKMKLNPYVHRLQALYWILRNNDYSIHVIDVHLYNEFCNVGNSFQQFTVINNWHHCNCTSIAILASMTGDRLLVCGGDYHSLHVFFQTRISQLIINIAWTRLDFCISYFTLLPVNLNTISFYYTNYSFLLLLF